MTSNHPEKLDAALIRPGRVDKVLHLGYMEAPEAILMVNHYFGQVTNNESKWLLSNEMTVLNASSRK
jgi:ATP-dependent 26S proteasome regulatory subunit